jgi:hypothetical protein
VQYKRVLPAQSLKIVSEFEHRVMTDTECEASRKVLQKLLLSAQQTLEVEGRETVGGNPRRTVEIQACRP